MRRWAAVLAGLLGAWGVAQADDPQVLDRCQAVYQGLRPQFAYAERAAPQRFFLRVVLAQEALPVVRITVNIDLIPVPLGLEDIAVVGLERPQQDGPRLRGQIARRLEGVLQNVNLGNWYVVEPRGFRCFLTYQGRVVGVIRLNRAYEPQTDPRWLQAYGRAQVRVPPNDPVPRPPGEPALR